MTTPHYLHDNPWPRSSDVPLLFILDAANKVERELLQDWVDHHRPDTATIDSAELVLSIGNGEKLRHSAELERCLRNSNGLLLCPLRVAWVPSSEFVDSGPRLRHLFFGDPRRPGRWTARRVVGKHPERVHCISGEPGTLDDLSTRFERRTGLSASADPGSFSDFVARQAGLTLEIAERRLQGGRYKVPRFVEQSLSASPAYIAGLEDLAAQKNLPAIELWKEARSYMKEMISIPSRFYLDVNARFNRFVLGLGYENQFVYDQQEVEKMRGWIRKHPSAVLWTHKTYLDGMVAPKLLYDNDFPMPHMFGGANMSFAGLGFLLRRAGGIFIRRSFQDNELYKLTLKHYIGYLMEKRFPMHWALEGTRSRIGKLMPPRYGLLKYVLEACYATDAEQIHIIPMSISYDLIRDVDEYATEQTGRVKSPESLRWFINYIRSLSRPMGRVYVDIGEPVILPRAPDPDDRLALSKIAFQIAVEVNRVTPITFPSLVTMALLGSAPRAMTTQEVILEVRELLAWATARGIRISSDFEPELSDHTRQVLDFMIGEHIITRYDEGPEVVYGIALEQHPVASYYRNTVIHFFVNKAIVELALLKVSEQPSDDPLKQFWTAVDRLRDLFKFEFFYSPTDVFHEEIAAELERAHPAWAERLAGGPTVFLELLEGLTPLVAHTALLTFAEAYQVVAEMLSRLPHDEAMEEKECINQALKYGRQAYLQRRISSEASIGKLLFQNSFKLMQHMDLTLAGDDSTGEKRRALAQEFRELCNRLERIKGIATASRIVTPEH